MSIYFSRYVAAMYNQHKQLLDGQALKEVQTFLHSEPELPAFAKVFTELQSVIIMDIAINQRVKSLRSTSVELGELRRSVRMNLLHLNCGQVNDLLSGMALELAEIITTHLVEDNRQKNKESVQLSLSHAALTHSLPPLSLCQRYDDIATRVYEDPLSTGEMVDLDQFLTNVCLCITNTDG